MSRKFKNFPMKMNESKCDSCVFSRIVVSENGFHPLCGLSSQKAVKCLTGYKEYYKAIRKETDVSAREEMSGSESDA